MRMKARLRSQWAAWFSTRSGAANAPGSIVIVYGEQSVLFDADSADYVRENGGGHIPMIAIPDARHHLMLDQPLMLLTALRALLADWEHSVPVPR